MNGITLWLIGHTLAVVIYPLLLGLFVGNGPWDAALTNQGGRDGSRRTVEDGGKLELGSRAAHDVDGWGTVSSQATHDVDGWETVPAGLEEELLTLADELRRHQDRLEDQAEILWLARAIYSESKRASEQALVAWVIRNRVESHYQGRSTYREVILAPFQFSAFNPGSAKRRYYASLTVEVDDPGWQQAYQVAARVYEAPASYRPFPITTRHFYSERSMQTDRVPHWGVDRQPVRVSHTPVEDTRFRFFAGVS